MKHTLRILLLLLAVACGRKEIIPAPDDSQLPVIPEQGRGNEGETPNNPEQGSNGAQIPPRVIPVLPTGGGVPEVRISITEAQWKVLLDAFDKNNNTQQYIHCDVTYSDGVISESIKDAGLRLKGNTSRRYPGEAGNLHHVHFGLHFEEYAENQKLLGASRLDLKWFKDDAAYCREVYCYDLFHRAGVWTAISSGYTRLWITIGGKETYMGVYELMEHVRGSYLKHRKDLFGGKDGHLWKARYGASLSDANAWMGVDDNEHDYTYELKSKPEEFALAKSQLQYFIRQLNTLKGEAFYNWAAETMDVELLLKTYAVNVAVGMWDDYWNNTNNFYFYFNPDGKFFFIPYDYDNTLGTSHDCGSQSDSGRQDPYHWGSDSNPLIVKLLGKAEWKAYYKKCLQELCAGDFAANASMDRIKGWHSVIAPYVSNDTGEDMEIKDRPASWGNKSQYRILSPGTNNFFTVKASVVKAMQ